VADLSGFKDKLNEYLAAGEEGSKEALRMLVGEVSFLLIASVHIDTARLNNAWRMAASQAGVGRWATIPLRASRRAKENRRKLGKQVKRLAGFLAMMELQGKKYRTKRGVPTGQVTPGYARIQRALEKARADYDSYQETDVLMFYGSRNKGVQESRLRKFTIRQRVYGGRGHWTHYGGMWTVSLVNMEPHAIVHEKQYMQLAFAKRWARTIGLRTVARPAMVRAFGKVQRLA